MNGRNETLINIEDQEEETGGTSGAEKQALVETVGSAAQMPEKAEQESMKNDMLTKLLKIYSALYRKEISEEKIKQQAEEYCKNNKDQRNEIQATAFKRLNKAFQTREKPEIEGCIALLQIFYYLYQIELQKQSQEQVTLKISNDEINLIDNAIEVISKSERENEGLEENESFAEIYKNTSNEVPVLDRRAKFRNQLTVLKNGLHAVVDLINIDELEADQSIEDSIEDYKKKFKDRFKKDIEESLKPKDLDKKKHHTYPYFIDVYLLICREIKSNEQNKRRAVFLKSFAHAFVSQVEKSKLSPRHFQNPRIQIANYDLRRNINNHIQSLESHKFYKYIPFTTNYNRKIQDEIDFFNKILEIINTDAVISSPRAYTRVVQELSDRLYRSRKGIYSGTRELSSLSKIFSEELIGLIYSRAIYPIHLYRVEAKLQKGDSAEHSTTQSAKSSITSFSSLDSSPFSSAQFSPFESNKAEVEIESQQPQLIESTTHHAYFAWQQSKYCFSELNNKLDSINQGLRNDIFRKGYFYFLSTKLTSVAYRETDRLINEIKENIKSLLDNDDNLESIKNKLFKHIHSTMQKIIILRDGKGDYSNSQEMIEILEKHLTEFIRYIVRYNYQGNLLTHFSLTKDELDYLFCVAKKIHKRKDDNNKNKISFEGKFSFLYENNKSNNNEVKVKPMYKDHALLTNNEEISNEDLENFYEPISKKYLGKVVVDSSCRRKYPTLDEVEDDNIVQAEINAIRANPKLKSFYEKLTLELQGHFALTISAYTNGISLNDTDGASDANFIGEAASTLIGFIPLPAADKVGGIVKRFFDWVAGSFNDHEKEVKRKVMQKFSSVSFEFAATQPISNYVARKITEMLQHQILKVVDEGHPEMIKAIVNRVAGGIAQSSGESIETVLQDAILKVVKMTTSQANGPFQYLKKGASTEDNKAQIISNTTIEDLLAPPGIMVIDPDDPNKARYYIQRDANPEKITPLCFRLGTKLEVDTYHLVQCDENGSKMVDTKGNSRRCTSTAIDKGKYPLPFTGLTKIIDPSSHNQKNDTKAINEKLAKLEKKQEEQEARHQAEIARRDKELAEQKDIHNAEMDKVQKALAEQQDKLAEQQAQLTILQQLLHGKTPNHPLKSHCGDNLVGAIFNNPQVEKKHTATNGFAFFPPPVAPSQSTGTGSGISATSAQPPVKVS